MEPRVPTREENAAAFHDEGVVAAYRHRPPYPDALISRLIGLAPGATRVVLELGCGTGELSRKLAPLVERVEAVDPSAAMLRAARSAEGGDAAGISWVCNSAEEFGYPSRYDLAVAAESLHWMDWEIVLPRLAEAMSPHGRLVALWREEDAPWSDGYRALAPDYSVIRDYQPVDVPRELERRGLWRLEGRETTAPVRFRQRVEDYIELQHSRSSLAPHRIGSARAAALDDALRSLLTPYARDGSVEYQTSVSLAWGRPNAR